MTTALEGVRVIDASRHMAGAMTGMMFADNGADVIKVEPPGGDPTRRHDGFLVWNRGKRGVVLDLGDAGSRDRLLRLAASADVFITDFRQGAAERLQVDHESLAPYNQRLVSVVISGFGDRGPLRELTGHEHIVAAKAGRMGTMNGYREGPIFTPTPIASYGAAMLATQGALAALHQRGSTGFGQRVHTSLLHALACYDMTSGFGHRMHQQDKTGRIFGVLPLAFMTARTADDRFIQMCSRQPHLFRNWLRVLGLESLLDEPGLSTMPDLLPSQAELERVRDILADAMRQKPFAEWMEIFLREDVGGDPFLTAEEYLRHPQATENGRTAIVESPSVGPTLQIGPIAQMSDTPSVIGRGEPLLGQHQAEVFGDVAATAAPQPRPSPGVTSPAAPLAGITVLEVGYFYAAPYAITLLAEMGARVIKLEPPAGDPARRNWSTPYDKETVGKQSIVADMKTPEGLRLVHELAARADVFLHNFRPGVPERLGIGYEQLHAINPRLVYVYGGAFGSRGPWAKRPGFHSSPNAIAGSGIIEAGRDNPPINRTYADPAGALATGTATLLALAARERTGRGQYVETTMLSSMAYTVSRWSVQYPGKAPGPLPDQGQHGFHALHRLYETADGWIFVLVPDDAAWARLAAEVGDVRLSEAQFATADGRRAEDDALTAALAAAFATDGADAWEARLAKAGVPAVRADGTVFGSFMLESEQSRANGLSIPSVLPDGTEFWRSAGSVEFSAAPIVHGMPEPLGNSTEAILRELGYDDAAIADLDNRGVTHAVGHGLDG
jgi:crotonobetainyl-CoA:carnitine CoA-transferase CaiB-like acyl-CoA transferase